jgi:hypothetical protein
MQKNDSDQCRRGYSRTETIEQTYVDDITDRVVHQHQQSNDLRAVPYNLQMMMDWDSHIIVEYSGSAFCALYLYKYCFKGPKQRERIEMNSEQQHDSHDEIKLLCMDS